MAKILRTVDLLGSIVSLLRDYWNFESSKLSIKFVNLKVRLEYFE